ncbi:MAG: DUF342 domain-containing protein [Desulfobacula sp.]|nr:DUF342 domain-containing protein [Desulfobacula sp.]
MNAHNTLDPNATDNGKRMPETSVQNIFGRENKSLISLAIKCRLIPLDREKDLLNSLAEKRRQTPGYSAVELFRQSEILSDENIAFLFSVRDHLETKMLDKKFGELGVANRFIQPESVKKALDRQSAIFKETSQSRLIGDILLENKEISKENKSAILLSQDRVKDEFLAEAMNDIAASEIEKISLNMRFGAIAVKKELITVNQLNQALLAQKTAAKSGQPKQYLGDILKQLFNLSDTDLQHILQIQKEMEKKRLSLEKALSLYNSETNTNKRLSKLFEYRFSKNKLAAFLRKTDESFQGIQVRDLITWLNSIGITWGICPEETIKQFLAESKIGMELQIAQGLPPQNGENGSNAFFFDTDLLPSESEDQDILLLVKKGDALARMIPPKNGIPGKDVCGFSIPAPSPRTMPLNCGEGVVKQEDLFIADTDGMPLLYKNRTLFVRPREQAIPTKYHTGSIDTDLGNRYLKVNLKVEGSISQKGKVRCQGIEISGDLLGQVSAAGEIRVKGHIGQPQLQVDDQAKIRAEGDILANKSIVNAIIVTAKSLKAPNADLISSAVLAFQDIFLRNVSDNGTRASILQTGKNPNLKAESLDSLIQTQTAELKKLRHQEELDELETKLNTKLAVKENYLKQHEICKYLLALTECRDLTVIPSIDQKLALVKKDPDAFSGLPIRPSLDEKDASEFLNHLLGEIASMDSASLGAHLQEMVDVKYGMYRAAVNATRRHQHEYEAETELVHKKVASQTAQILKKEETIKKLMTRKDTLLLSQGYLTHPVPPAIKVKNLVQKGTVIMGQKARLTVEQDIHGVKFMEIQKSPAEVPAITIEGFYE